MPIKPPAPRESKVQRAVRSRLLYHFGIRLWRRNVGAMTDPCGNFVRFGSPGQADLWGIDRTSRHWELETKRPGCKPTDLQLAWLKQMSAYGCVAFWVDDPDVAARVAAAVLAGGKIVWHEDENFDLEMPT